MGKKEKVLVGLSGGVDSAVTAHLLLQQGYDVIGGFMINYTDETNPNCHTTEDRKMAFRVAQFLGIKTFITFDFREEYEQTIIRYITEGYKQGYTPNPDVLCNTKIKFDLFLQAGRNLGCDYVATGHYARIEKVGETYQLHKGVDTSKDQSYFLAGLSQDQLSQALYPLGSLMKKQVREIAHEIGLPNADRKDSQGLCFIGKVPMKEFLLEHLPTQLGEIKNTDGEVLGEHQGHYFYTIGQRQGLGLAGGPWYVVEKRAATNEVIVGQEDDQALFATICAVVDWHRVDPTMSFPVSGQAKIRYRQPDQEVTLDYKNQTLQATFTNSQRAITSGQVFVLYQGTQLLGSGIIQ